MPHIHWFVAGLILMLAPAVMAQPEPSTKPTSQPAPKEVADAIDEGIALMEAGKYEDVLNRFVPPAELARMKKEEGQFAKVVEEFAKTEKAPDFLKALKAAKGQNAVIKEGDSKVCFELEGSRPLNFLKIEGKWYIK